MRFIQLFGIFILCSVLLSAQDGKIDPSFSNDGFYYYGSLASNSHATSMVRFTDGSIIIACYEDKNRPPFYIKVDSSGVPAPTFGENGLIVILETFQVTNNYITLQGNDKFVTAYSQDKRVFLNRWFPDGRLDSTFGVAGTKVLHYGDRIPVINSLIIDNANRIIIGTTDSHYFLEPGFGVKRLLENGEIDASFANSGYILLSDIISRHYLTDICINETNDVFVTGYKYTYPTGKDNLYTIKFFQTGKIDSSFGNQGAVTYNYGWSPRSNTVKTASDGSVFVGGSLDYHPDIGDCFVLMKYDSNGNSDSLFGDRGLVKTFFQGGDNGVNDILLQPDNKVIAGGYANYEEYINQNGGIAMVRFLPDGSPDLDFGTNGKLLIHLSSGHEAITKITLQPDMSILGCGYLIHDGIRRPMIVRFLNNKPFAYIRTIVQDEMLIVG